MIVIKSKREIELMRHAGDIVARCHEMLKEHIVPGISTGELDRKAESFIRENGATPSFKGYNGFPSSICASINEVVVHGIPSDRSILKEGDIIAVDIGACYKGYHADSAWTYPVGKVSAEVTELMEVTKQSLFAGISVLKPGCTVRDISMAVENTIKPYKYGIVEEFTGHGIGKKVHEDPYIPNFVGRGDDVILREGMVICIEPMVNLGKKAINIRKDNWTVCTKDRKPSAHYEHMVAITNEGFDILTIKEAK